jgi:excisionase family DNA binding protein
LTDPDRDLQANGGIEPLLSIEEVAQVLRISESGVYRLIRREELCCVKVGCRTLFEPLELRAFIATQRQGAAANSEQPTSNRKEAA